MPQPSCRGVTFVNGRKSDICIWWTQRCISGDREDARYRKRRRYVKFVRHRGQPLLVRTPLYLALFTIDVGTDYYARGRGTPMYAGVVVIHSGDMNGIF